MAVRPNEDKYTFSAVFEMDEDAKIHNQWFGRSEHAPFESTSGSIGTTRSTRYTLVARVTASSSKMESGLT